MVYPPRTLLLPLDGLLVVARGFICPDVSRSGLDRCLRRHGAGRLNAPNSQEPAVPHKAFKSYERGIFSGFLRRKMDFPLVLSDAGFNDAVCEFPSELDEGEPKFDGVRLEIFDEAVVVSNSEFYEIVSAVCAFILKNIQRKKMQYII
jgi:hypothetical protein